MTIVNHEAYVSLEVAKLLKEAEFDWMCSSLYGMDVRHKGISIDEDEEYELKSSGRGDEIEYIDGGAVYDIYNNNKDPHCYSRPTFDVAQRWLRENKDFDINVLTDFDSAKRLYYVRYVVKDGHYKTYYITKNQSYVYFNTYEEAQEAGIKKALEIILEKGI